MGLHSQSELESTRRKLRLLEERYEAHANATSDSPHARKLTMQSLRRLINQLKEEIARYESKTSMRQQS